MMNALEPDWGEFLNQAIDLRYCNPLMAAEGEQAMRALWEAARETEGRYILVIEGAISTAADGLYTTIGEEGGRVWTALAALERLAPGARHIVAVGTCASFGGIAAATPNVAGNKGVGAVLRDRRVINASGCPPHPDWLMVTLAHLILYGRPEVDAYGRPTILYGRRIHDQCHLLSFYDSGIFAKYPGDFGCTYKIGCKGPITFADCPSREWNGRVSWCVEPNSICIGCTEPTFPDQTGPFFEQLGDQYVPGTTINADTLGLGIMAAAAGACAINLAGSWRSGRLARHMAGIPSEERLEDGTHDHDPPAHPHHGADED